MWSPMIRSGTAWQRPRWTQPFRGGRARARMVRARAASTMRTLASEAAAARIRKVVVGSWYRSGDGAGRAVSTWLLACSVARGRLPGRNASEMPVFCVRSLRPRHDARSEPSTMKATYLTSDSREEILSLVGSTVVQIRVSAHRVEIIFDGLQVGPASLSIESSATFRSHKEDGQFEAGQELGSAWIPLLGNRVQDISLDDLDLRIKFRSDCVVTVHCDNSGYESYTLQVEDRIWVALSAGPPPAHVRGEG